MPTHTRLSSLGTSLLPVALATALFAPATAEASKFVFPHHHPDLQWHTIETEHFYVHYPVSRREKNNDHYIDSTWAARKMATVADEMYEPMCAEFDYYLTEKVHIVLIDQPDELQGFTIPAWDWIEISANPGNTFYRMRGRMEWFADVLVHEYAHVVSLKKNSATHEGVQGVLVGGLFQDGVNDQQHGAELFFGDTDPFWWTEGGAEYWSDNTGYNWWTPSRDTNLRNTVLEDRLLTYDEWITRMEKRDWGDGERGYQQGYSFALYLRERFGDKTYTEFANESSKRWRMNWETVVEDVTGVDLKTLYDDWKAYLEKKYGTLRDEVRAEGEIVGKELIPSRGAWEFTSPADREAWLDKRLMDREDEQENTGGSWDIYPKYSPDGKWFAEHYRGRLKVTLMPEGATRAFTGADMDSAANADFAQQAADRTAYLPMAFGHGFDFVPGADRLVVTGKEDMLKHGVFRMETDGYDWNQLYVVDLEPLTDKRKHRGGKEEYATLDYKPKHHKKIYTAIPNTQRGTSPAVSPDGERVAYLEYADGTQNLVVINLDGSEKRYLTDFHDGTWMQDPDWSPDGSKIVLGIFRNYQQDLFVVDVETGELTALNRDEWEDQDAHWAEDGWIYFSSDPTWVFNIYRMHPETREVQQLTNVIQAAQAPEITPEGNLMYTNLTGHGWKNYGLAADEFMYKPVDYFGTDVDDELVAEQLAYSEDLSYWEESTRKYNAAKSFMTPTAVPIFRFENDSRTNLGLSAGLQLFAMDFIEDHTAFAYVMLGEDPLFAGGYSFQHWYPTFNFFFQHYRAKFDYGLLVDDDNNPATLRDNRVFDGKQHQYVNVGMMSIDYPWNDYFSTSLWAQGMEYGFQGVSDMDFEPFLRNVNFGIMGSYNNVWGGGSTANARGGRFVQASLSREYSDMVYKPYQGRDTDDGQIMDDYWYNRVEVNWTEQLPAPTFGIQALDFVRKRQHTLQLNGQVGFIDRNVQFQDEFRAGGTHPYYIGSGAIQPNNQFSGYPGFSLSGETMVMLSGAWRFPLAQKINKKVGPLYVYDLHAQIGGTAGNLWSFRPPEEGDVDSYYYDGFGQRVAYDPKDVRREIPFIDEAYKNGNRLLWDANAEIRLSSTMMGAPWGTFLRVAYAFNEIRGINDVDGDDISDTTDPGTGNSLSNETEKPGPRIFLGVGTGW